jgi:hypothetical protein
MKLLFCTFCHDVVKLGDQKKRFCQCKRSWGYYKEDGLHAVIGGLAIPVGFANPSFYDAIFNRPNEGMGSKFEAFIIPHKCPTIEEEEHGV